MSVDNRSRGWCFTINNYTEEDENIVYAMSWDCAYIVCGREVGDSGTPHLQGYIYYKNAVRLSTMKEVHPTAHWEPQRGTPQQASDYCKKDGELGLRSSIPSALVSEQSLVLPESSMGNRRGMVSYGAMTTNMLGVNQNAKVSTSLWQALSPYQGVIYDYAYFNQQFKKYATTTWDGTSTISYDDNGKGYQIFKVNGSVNNFSYSPTGTQKVIFIVNGDVTINSNITVPNGAFLAVLSSGSINFGTLVTNADGWYLADNIYIRCVDNDSDSQCDRNDNQFVGNGSFVAWIS